MREGLSQNDVTREGEGSETKIMREWVSDMIYSGRRIKNKGDSANFPSPG